MPVLVRSEGWGLQLRTAKLPATSVELLAASCMRPLTCPGGVIGTQLPVI